MFCMCLCCFFCPLQSLLTSLLRSVSLCVLWARKHFDMVEASNGSKQSVPSCICTKSTQPVFFYVFNFYYFLQWTHYDRFSWQTRSERKTVTVFKKRDHRENSGADQSNLDRVLLIFVWHVNAGKILGNYISLAAQA